MNLEVDVERLTLAQKAVRAELLAERAAGHWSGQLGSSPFATAAAVSALVVAHQRDSRHALQTVATGEGQPIEHVVQGDLSELLLESVNWLAQHQNSDGGWGDCVGARSNVGATMLVQAAFRLTGIPAKFADLTDRADDFVKSAAGLSGLRRQYGPDKPVLAAILANCALAGMVTWQQVPTPQFELACLPQQWQRDLQVFAARPALPILLAVGHAKFHHDPPANPISRLLRRGMRAKSIALLEQYLKTDDNYAASTPITAFVIMSLSSMGYQDHTIVRRGVDFLFSSVRADASWSATPNLAVSNTALAWNSLAVSPAADSRRDWPEDANDHVTISDDHAVVSECCCDWLLSRQQLKPNALTHVPQGGWASTDANGALPSTNATAGVLLALATLHSDITALQRDRAEHAASRGIAWLLNLQNDDGGWPTYYRDDTRRFDQSAADVAAHVLRALGAWRSEWRSHSSSEVARTSADVMRAIERGWKFLESQQQEDGSFIPLWFGNEYQPDQRNFVYGTSQVLLACGDLERLDTDTAKRAASWLMAAQHTNGGWGPPRAPVDYAVTEKDGPRGRRANEAMVQFCSVEETALAISALLPLAENNLAIPKCVSRGLTWLINAIEQDSHRHPAILGFTSLKLWYDERLYPLAFAAGALSQAVRSVRVETPAASHVG
ncbi:MAG TPA: prenyltransferase/squalene oxidase repeat-containing protein [Lacipirellulaceae bacterium]|nr:prenyltransferase/squalene oxidase repeat-containing protein [Lacipirellulaceae bacterium]